MGGRLGKYRRIFTRLLLEEELPLREVVTSRAGWLVHGQQLDPLDLLKRKKIYNIPSVVRTVI